MQVFLPYAQDFEKSAQSLDDVRLSKQIVELCQILTTQYNMRHSQTAVIGYANHPIVRQYDTPAGTVFLLDYGFVLCKEFQFRFGKTHQGQFTLLGLKMAYGALEPPESCNSPAVYVKGQRGNGQVITSKNISALYQKLLSEKWANETPKWTRREKPVFYKKNTSPNG